MKNINFIPLILKLKKLNLSDRRILEKYNYNKDLISDLWFIECFKLKNGNLNYLYKHYNI